MQIDFDTVASPVGTLLLAEGPTGLSALVFEEAWRAARVALLERFPHATLVERATRAARALREWIAGDLAALDTLVVDPGGTPFQRRVWSALRAIPVGQVRSYGEIAASIGLPGGARAAGAANRANPVAIVIPCHRVIAADGTLGGYAGDWACPGATRSTPLVRKAWLLEHEGVAIDEFRVRRPSGLRPR